MKIPKMSIKNSGNSIENNFGEERVPLRHKKVGSPALDSSCVILEELCAFKWTVLINGLFLTIILRHQYHDIQSHCPRIIHK